ncbi:YadA C-terminal domain-containing protein [Aliivibrio finisterrensis]|uniref:YadA C-terminal domain-containing protein n=1 Tax=Aliivibrio finisterrensis TaxID=511998 RepID=UPI001F5D4E58|nr:YadA C-terminal domain-containing protein [Aliivibrio finisterrensis]
MKKSILALSLTAIFSSSVMAETIQNSAELPGIDNSVPSVSERPQPDFGNTPDWGLGPTQPPVADNSPERPTPDFGDTPHWGISPDKPVDRPQPDDASPDYGKPMPPTQPPMDDSPEWGLGPTQPPMDNTPEWGIPHVTDGERITSLENEFKAMAEENNRRFNEQDEKIDGVRAGLHAVANARPFVTSGEFAIGAGVGFSGSKEALALGGAYGINEQLSVSGTFHYESSGSYSSSDVAGGVGVQYSFK